MPTVDFEAYLNFEYDGGKPFDVDQLERMEDEAGIDMAVLMPANRGPLPEQELQVQPDNERLATAIAGRSRLIGCATINPALGVDNVRRQFEIIDRHGFVGPKLMAVIHGYDIDDEIVDPVMAMTSERELVASIHSDSRDDVHPNRIANLARRFPEVPIIMDHMGYPGAVEEAIQAAEGYPNIYLGATILRFFDPQFLAHGSLSEWAPEFDSEIPHGVADAVGRVGPARIVWGSNLPEYAHSPLWCRRLIERLKLGAEAAALIFGETLSSLYHLGSDLSRA
jgi:uncharacterized protein